MSTTLNSSAALREFIVSPQSPRVGYDARFTLGEYRGMGRYLRRLVQPAQAQAVGFAAHGESDPELRLRARGFRFFPLWEQLSLPRRAQEAGVEFLIAPYNTAPLRTPRGVKLILVLHDFIYMRSTSELPLSRSAYQNFGRLYRRWNVPRAVHHAHRIICVSEYTRQELLRRFRVDANKVCVIPNTVEASWFQLQPTHSNENYVLCVSGEAPNKNLDRALHGFAEYCRIARDKTTLLKIAGVKRAHQPAFVKIASQLSIADRVVFLDYLPYEDLQMLYAGARAFFFPSRDEGFGIPVLEALAAGVPVISSNSSSLPEVAGEVALYFHPDSVSGMGEQLCAVLTNPQLQATMSHRSRERAARFHPCLVDAMIAEFWEKTLGADA